jgi:hypothetical protein
MKAIPRRALLLALAGLVAAGIATGVALAARSAPPSIGTGVVVIETNLAYRAATPRAPESSSPRAAGS